MGVTSHAKLGASNAKRWMNCPGSIKASEGIKPAPNKLAAQGTFAHGVAEACLRMEMDAADMIGHKGEVDGFTFVVDEEMADAIQVYLDVVRKAYKRGRKIFIEQKFDLAHINEHMFGTNDAAVYVPRSKKLIIFDYKHGSGVWVPAEDNPQLKYYALGAINELQKEGHEVDVVELVIVQPRCRQGDPVRRWETNVEQLHEFAEELKKAAEVALGENPPLKAGEHCKFCPATPTCKAIEQYTITTAKAEFAAAPKEITFIDPASLNEEQLGEVLRRAALLEDWLNSVRRYAHQQAERGTPPKGWKLVERRAIRKWRDEDEAIKTLLDKSTGLDKEDIFVKKLKSPAQIEKLLKDEFDLVKDQVVKESSGTVLAPESDQRPAITPSAIADFSNT